MEAGIPDFRSPDIGLYANLQEFNLPAPESVFDINFFRDNPQPFYQLAQSFLDTSKFKATFVHHFCKMLFDRGLVKFYLTQNIDNLESKADFSPDQIIQAHGANTGAVCSVCGEEQDR